MGILDNKTRFIDLVITQEGKRQIASGKLRAEFASISDTATFYSKGDHDDVTFIFLHCCYLNVIFNLASDGSPDLI